MSLKSKIEAVVYASEEPVTLAQLVVLLSEEAQSELDALAARQSELPLGGTNELSEGSFQSDDRAMDDLPGIEQASPDALVTEASLTRAEAGATDADSIEGAAASEIYAQLDSAPKGDNDETPAGAENNSSFEAAPAGSAALSEVDKRQARDRERAIREYLRSIVDAIMRDYANSDRGLEIREVAGGFRFGTKPEYHDAVRGFVKSLKPALKLSLQALETLAVVAYKQPVTAAEISEIRGVDSAGVLGGLLTRKLIQTAGRKQVIGRPMLYKTTREFLVRFGLRDVQELPSMEEFERMAGELAEQEDLPMDPTESVIERANARGDAEHIRETNEPASAAEGASPAEEAGQPPTGVNHPAQPDESSQPAPLPPRSETSDSSPRAEAEPAGAEQDPA